MALGLRGSSTRRCRYIGPESTRWFQKVVVVFFNRSRWSSRESSDSSMNRRPWGARRRQTSISTRSRRRVSWFKVRSGSSSSQESSSRFVPRGGRENTQRWKGETKEYPLTPKREDTRSARRSRPGHSFIISASKSGHSLHPQTPSGKGLRGNRGEWGLGGRALPLARGERKGILSGAPQRGCDLEASMRPRRSARALESDP